MSNTYLNPTMMEVFKKNTNNSFFYSKLKKMR